jgi:hypothetical protein
MESTTQRADVHRNNAARTKTDENPMTGKMLCLNDTLSLGILFNNNPAFQPAKRPAVGSKSPQQPGLRQRMPIHPGETGSDYTQRQSPAAALGQADRRTSHAGNRHSQPDPGVDPSHAPGC